jgi:hypothetical protein
VQDQLVQAAVFSCGLAPSVVANKSLLPCCTPTSLLDIATSNLGVITEYLLLILLLARGMITVITSSCVITIDFTLNITKIKKQKRLIYV